MDKIGRKRLDSGKRSTQWSKLNYLFFSFLFLFLFFFVFFALFLFALMSNSSSKKSTKLELSSVTENCSYLHSS